LINVDDTWHRPLTSIHTPVHTCQAELSSHASKKARQIGGTEAALSSSGIMGWTGQQEEALRKACVLYGPDTANRWDKVAAKVGGGKTKDACKKHSKELPK